MFKSVSTLSIIAIGSLSMTSAVARWNADIRPISKSSVTITGSAQAETQGSDSLKITLSIDGAPHNSTMRWHLSPGPCGTVADAALGGENAYPALRTVGSSHTSVTVTVAVQPDPTAAYEIQVHAPTPTELKENPKAAIEKTAVVACGELAPSAATGN